MRFTTGVDVRSAKWLLSVALISLVISSCGGSPHLNTSFVRTPDAEHATWVGAFWLSKATALDDVSNNDLIERPDDFATRGVIYYERASIYPGGDPWSVSIPVQNYNFKTSWLLLIANLPGSEACSRHKVMLNEKPKVDLQITVGETCLEIVEP
jgi:hypothetical protein